MNKKDLDQKQIDIPTTRLPSGSERQEPIRFTVKLRDGVNGREVKADLEQLASDVKIHVLKLNNLQLVSGTTTQTTYESLFNTSVAYESRVILNLNRGPRTVYGWIEKSPAHIPAGLENKISYIGLEKKMHLTD